MEFVGIWELLDVELGSEGLRCGVALVVLPMGVVVAILIEEAEERGEGGAGLGDKTSWEERHFARRSRCEEYSLSDWRSSWECSCS